MVRITCIKCPPATVVGPPIRAAREFFHPQIVQVIHPIEVINRHHCVPIPQHVVTYAEKDVPCGPGLTVSGLKKKSRTKQRRKV